MSTGTVLHPAASLALHEYSSYRRSAAHTGLHPYSQWRSTSAQAHTRRTFTHRGEVPGPNPNPNPQPQPHPNVYTQEEKNDQYVSQMFDSVKIASVKKVPRPPPRPTRPNP